MFHKYKKNKYNYHNIMSKQKAPKILKVRDFDGDERFKDIHPNLMIPPSLTLICGSIKSGKSNLIINLLCNPDFYLNKFDIVRVMSSTLHMDEKMKILDKHFDCSDHYEDKFIDAIVAEQGQYDKDDPLRPKYCLVLDDILTQDFMKRSNKLSFFSTRMRHYIDLMIISTQSLNHVPPLIRAQVRDLIIAKQQNHKEVVKLQEQFGGLLGEGGDKKFIELYNQVHSEPYQMMYMKLSENPIHVFKNFSERIF
jgi:hypothetical protein